MARGASLFWLDSGILQVTAVFSCEPLFTPNEGIQYRLDFPGN